MLIIILSAIFLLGVATAFAFTDKNWELMTRFRVFLAWTGVFFCLHLFITAAVLRNSYLSYLDAKAFYTATIEQYAAAVEIYQDKAVIDVESAAWTDLKYQGYQDNISGLILDLRNSIVSYNDTYVKKRTLKKNPFFNWLIIDVDDDMKLIKMKVTGGHDVKDSV